MEDPPGVGMGIVGPAVGYCVLICKDCYLHVIIGTLSSDDADDSFN